MRGWVSGLVALVLSVSLAAPAGADVREQIGDRLGSRLADVEARTERIREDPVPGGLPEVDQLPVREEIGSGLDIDPWDDWGNWPPCEEESPDCVNFNVVGGDPEPDPAPRCSGIMCCFSVAGKEECYQLAVPPPPSPDQE